MRKLFLKTVFIFVCAVTFQVSWAQQSSTGTIKYVVFTTPEVEMQSELFFSNNTVEFPGKESVDIIIRGYLKKLFESNMHIKKPFSVLPERYYLLTDILENKPSVNNSVDTITIKDSLIQAAGSWFLSNKGNFYRIYEEYTYDDYGNEIVDDNGNIAFSNQISLSATLSDQIRNLTFTEDWKYLPGKGKFTKENLKINLGYEKNEDMDYPFRMYQLVDLPNNNLNPDKKLFDEIIYDVRISPFYIMSNGQYDGQSHTIAIPDYNYLENRKREELFTNLLKDLKSGVISGYKILDNQIDKSKAMSYNEILAALSATIFEADVYDVEKQRKFMDYKINPIINQRSETEYVLDDSGNPVLDDYGNYVLIYSTVDDTVGMDTIWTLKPQYRVISSIETITIPEPQYDESGTPVYNEYGEAVMTMVEKQDTVWGPSQEVLDYSKSKISLTYKHDKMEGFVGIRFYETWFFDEKEFCLKKQVNAIGLIMEGKCLLHDILKVRFGLDMPFFNNYVKIYIQLKND